MGLQLGRVIFVTVTLRSSMHTLTPWAVDVLSTQAAALESNSYSSMPGDLPVAAAHTCQRTSH